MASSRTVRRDLPDEVRALLDGSEIETKIGCTIEVLSTDAPGWPRVALLSVGEVLATGATDIRLSLWPRTTTTENLRKSGRATLFLVQDSTAYSIRLDVRAVRMIDEPEARALFVATVVEVTADVVGYATVTSGVTFRLHEPEVVLPRWRESIAAMRATDGDWRQ